jgi:arsenite-transporting ATPase
VARLTFVVGKGGVGKTTVASALALHEAARPPKGNILLMSTDPAHSLGDVLQVRLGPRATNLKIARGRLAAWELDADREFKKFLSANRDSILKIVESGTMFTREEIAPLLDTALPGMAEMAGLLVLDDLLTSGNYQRIIVDTAPFGHTLRLLEMPAHFQRFLDFLDVASQRDAVLAQTFARRRLTIANPFVERWRAAVERLRTVFEGGEAELLVVTSPEAFSLNQAGRWLKSLKQSGPAMPVGALFLNRATVKRSSCPVCRKRFAATDRARKLLKDSFPDYKLFVGPDPGNPVLGIDALKRFGDVVFGGASARLERKPHASKPLRLKAVAWPALQQPLALTAGKGGVGKTTITAALAFHARSVDKKTPVIVCSTDPAPSLDDVFRTEVGRRPVPVLEDTRFSAMEMDSVTEYRAWSQEMELRLAHDLSTQSGGLHVDLSFEREVFSALLKVVPPGVDELLAIFKIIELLDAGKGRICIDMAPTGHALELLRMPERMLHWSRLLLKSLSAHRTLALAQDVAVELATLGQRVRRLLELMRDPGQVCMAVVMLPEPVPDSETRRLIKAIEELGIAVQALFINRVQIKSAVSCQLCKRRRDWQLATLGSMRLPRTVKHVFFAGEHPAEVSGVAALRSFTNHLWQIQR